VSREGDVPKLEGEMLKGHLDMIVLAALSSRPAHGYAIIQEIRHRSGGAFDLPEGTVYPALHRLEDAGLLSGEWHKSDAGRPRRVYSLTRRGQTALAVQHDIWRHFTAAVGGFFSETRHA
jgi:transcriptional regulator